MSAVRRLAAGEAPALAAIVRGLPEYFTDDVPGKVEHDADSHEAWVITDDGTITGFAIAARKSPGGAEILWIAVDAPRRGQGHGTRLLNNVMDDLAETGVSVVTVKTLDSSAGYAPYEATRAFYEHNGFVYIDTIDPLPGWPPGNPAITPGYHLNKRHWNTVELDGSVPDEELLDLIDHSYDLVVTSLTKAQRDSLPPRP
jgi:GNAT superfamily N-acetyltransferase